MADDGRRADGPRGQVPAHLLERVRRAIARDALLAPEGRVLVACSGGADSLALLALLYALDPRPPLVVAHVDHGLRSGSEDDARAVASLAASLGLDCRLRRLAWEEPAGEVSEDAARQARHGALQELADEAGAAHIAFGHTADDQLETVLMRLCRGAGATGLAGISPRRGRLVRPLLELTRADVEEVVAAVGWTARQDPTNRTDRFLRNRIRHDVVPLLVRENPRLAAALARSTRVLRDELDALTVWERTELARLGWPDPFGTAVDVAGLAALPRGLASRIVRRLWRGATPRVRSGAEAELGEPHVTQVLEMLGPKTTGRAELPGGVSAVRQYDTLLLCAAADLEDPGDVSVRVDGVGTYELPAFGLALEVGGDLGRPADGPPAGVMLLPAAPTADAPLIVRNHRPGDRVAIPGGHQKVSDLLVDQKVPRHQRRRLPLVEVAGEIRWIPGVWQKATPPEDLAHGACGLSFTVKRVAKAIDGAERG